MKPVGFRVKQERCHCPEFTARAFIFEQEELDAAQGGFVGHLVLSATVYFVRGRLHKDRTKGSERESVKCPIWRGLERLRPAAGCRLARQSLYAEPQIQRWRPVWGGRTFHASRRSWKESSHPIDSIWLGTPARLIAGTLGGTGIPHRFPWLGRSVPTKAAGIPWLPNGQNPSIPRRLKNPECCHQTRPLSPETLRPGRPSLASQSTRTKPFKPEPNERTSLYSFLRRANYRSERIGRSAPSRLQHEAACEFRVQRVPAPKPARTAKTFS